MKIQEINAEALKEALQLRKHALQSEKDQLLINKVKPTSVYECIYGRLTGYCYSRRADRLIQECATMMFSTHSLEKGSEEYSYEPLPIDIPGPFRMYTALEVAIMNTPVRKALVNVILGKQDTL